MHCGIGSCGVPRPSMGVYVTVTEPTDGAPAPGGCLKLPVLSLIQGRAPALPVRRYGPDTTCNGLCRLLDRVMGRVLWMGRSGATRMGSIGTRPVTSIQQLRQQLQLMRAIHI